MYLPPHPQPPSPRQSALRLYSAFRHVVYLPGIRLYIKLYIKLESDYILKYMMHVPPCARASASLCVAVCCSVLQCVAVCCSVCFSTVSSEMILCIKSYGIFAWNHITYWITHCVFITYTLCIQPLVLKHLLLHRQLWNLIMYWMTFYNCLNISSEMIWWIQ